MPNKVFTEIKARYNTLSPTQKTIADFVLNNSENVMLLSINDLAASCGTSETTVMRFIRKLGYSSYQIFRLKIAQEIPANSSKAVYEDIKVGDNVSQIKHKVITSTINSISDLSNLIDDAIIEKVVNIILGSSRLLFFGIGGSSFIAQDAFHKFLRLGLNVLTETSPHIMSIHCAHSNFKDILFLVSHSGESKEALECAKLARENGTKIIALTSYKKSTLTKLSDYVLLSSTNESKYHTDAMVSRIIQLVIIDMIYVILVLKLGDKGINKISKSRLAVAKSKT